MSYTSSDSASESDRILPRRRMPSVRQKIAAWRKRNARQLPEDVVPARRRRLNNGDQQPVVPAETFLRIKRCTRAGTDRSILKPNTVVALKHEIPGTLDYLFNWEVAQNLEELHLDGFGSWRPQLPARGRGRLYLPNLRLLTMNALHPHFEVDLHLDAPNLRTLKINNPILSHNGDVAREVTDQIEELHLSFGEFEKTILADESVSFKSLVRLYLDGSGGYIIDRHFKRFAKQLTHVEIRTENPDLVHTLVKQATNLKTLHVYAEVFVNIRYFKKLTNLKELIFTGWYSERSMKGVHVVLPALSSLSAEIEMAPHFITPKLHEIELVVREEGFDSYKVRYYFERISHHVHKAVFRVQNPDVIAVPIDLICMLHELESLTLSRLELGPQEVQAILMYINIRLRRLRFTQCHIRNNVVDNEPMGDAFFDDLRDQYRAMRIIVDEAAL